MSSTCAPSLLNVSRKPRVDVIPPSLFSVGDLAIEYCRRAGLELDWWQQEALMALLAVRADGKWVCREYCEMVPRQNGKGALLEARALAGFFLLGEELITWTAHEFKTTNIAFRRMRRHIKKLGKKVGDNESLYDVDGVLVRIYNSTSNKGFERLDTEAELKFIARSKDSGRGFTGDLVIIDEAYAYTDDQHAALLPTQRALPNPQIVYTSTPPLSGSTGEVLYRLRARAEAGKSARLGYRDWGLAGDLEDALAAMNDPRRVSERIDINNPEVIASCNPAYGIRITAESTSEEMESLSLEKALRELFGLWPRPLSKTGGVLPRVKWDACLDTSSEAMADGVAVAVDASPGLVSASIGMVGAREDGKRHWQMLEHNTGTWWVVDKLKALRADGVDFDRVGVDPSAPAGALIPDLKAAGFEVEEVSGQKLAQAWGAFTTAVLEGEGRHIGQPLLDAALRDCKTGPSGDADKFSRKRSDGDISPLVAVTIADYVHRTAAPEVVQQFFGAWR